jgi:hypothetical protein
MGSVNPDYFIHIANILLLAAYSVRDILWLRLLAVASSLIAIPYLILQPAPLWAAFGWTVLFIGVNTLQAGRLFRERRPVKLTPEEEEVRKLVFGALPSREVLRVVGIGSWSTVATGERLVEPGRPLESLALIVRGSVELVQAGRTIGKLNAGEFVGSALLLTGAVADLEAVTLEPSRMLRWELGTLERYLNANPNTRIVFQRHLARELAGKLERVSRDTASAT